MDGVYVYTGVHDDLIINGQSQEGKKECSNFLYIWNCFRSLLNTLEEQQQQQQQSI